MFMGEMEALSNFLDITKFDVYTFGVSPIQIDIMTACKGIKFIEAYSNSVNYTTENDIEVRVIHYNQLIQAKTATHRTRDKAEIEELEKIKKENKKHDKGLSH